MPTSLVCPCGATFTAKPSQIARGARFCSRACLHRYGGRAAGATAHPLYSTWENIKARTAKHPRYAGRGIGMAPEWAASSRAFLDYLDRELGSRPDGATLDRIYNDLGYQPGNLRWATAAQQQHNRGQRGVSRHRDGHWTAQITREYRHLYVGYFPSEDEAAAAYRDCVSAYDAGGIDALLRVVESHHKRR